MNIEDKNFNKRQRMSLDLFLVSYVEDRLGRRKKYKNYSIKPEGKVTRLIYTAYDSVYRHEKCMAERLAAGEEDVAMRVAAGLVFSNSDRLCLCGSYMTFGRRYWRSNSKAPAIESLERFGTLPIPFTVFRNANLNLAHVRVIEKAPAENIVTMASVYNTETKKEFVIDEPRRFAGACLFEVEGNYFLTDVDREELKYKRYSPFLTRLCRPAATIQEAYQSLKPQEVCEAEENGMEIVRVGEFFFIKKFDLLPVLPKPPAELLAQVENPPDARKFGAAIVPEGYQPGSMKGFDFSDKVKELEYFKALTEWEEARRRLADYSPHRGKLQVIGHTPSRVDRYVSCEGLTLVSGKITHLGGHHRVVELGGFWCPIPNTAAKSWRISGEED